MDGKFSSNHKWKNKYFVAIGQWEFHPTEATKGLRVPWETCASAANASKEPRLTKKELKRVNDILTWAQEHERLMSFTTSVRFNGKALHAILSRVPCRIRCSRKASKWTFRSPLLSYFSTQGILNLSGIAYAFTRSEKGRFSSSSISHAVDFKSSPVICRAIKAYFLLRSSTSSSRWLL
jgi:hypothetical protein